MKHLGLKFGRLPPSLPVVSSLRITDNPAFAVGFATNHCLLQCRLGPRQLASEMKRLGLKFGKLPPTACCSSSLLNSS